MRNDLVVYLSGDWEFDPVSPKEDKYLVYKGVGYLTEKEIISLVSEMLHPIVKSFFSEEENA
ncbi:hypothetical protein ACPF8X_37980 [Streptomyces sp. G35A]